MKTMISPSSSTKRYTTAAGERRSFPPKPDNTLRIMVALAWVCVLLPLAWGIYETVRITVPLLDALSSKY